MQEHSGEQDFAPEEKPCLVDTGRGFSVSYKSRFLYSKYAPEKAILGAINSFTLLPGSLVLAFSPVLWLGLPLLLQKLPENCFVLGIETNKSLHEFAQTTLEKLRADETSDFCMNFRSHVALLPFEDNDYIVNILSDEDFPSKSDSGKILPHVSHFRRAIPLEMSAGTQLNKAGYVKFASLAQNTIASFWKNRITLTKMGRLYSRNLFKNLANIPQSLDFRSLAHTVSQPIFVFGAGESIEETLKKIPKNKIEKCFIMAVDAASPSLQAHGIRIDAICAIEGQLAIEKAYIGGTAKKSLIIADITSRSQVTRHSERLSFIASKYTDSQFFKNLSLKEFFPPLVPPLGSVGLTAVHIASLLRKDQNVPIFVSGLDFSFSLGRTHAKNAPAHVARLCLANKLHPAENYDAAFRTGAKKIIGKNNIPVYTDTTLTGYANSFTDFFNGTPNLYDSGAQGLPLGIQEISSEKLSEYLETVEAKEKEFCTLLRPNRNDNEAKENDLPAKKSDANDFSFRENNANREIREYLEAEEKALNRIKELLMFGNDVASCSCSIEEELHALIAPREYLFLHFPDGYKCNTRDLSFLKRVRGQLDFFLKDIKRSLATLLSL